MLGTVKLIIRPKLLLLHYKMHMVSNCLLNIYAYTHRQMLLSALIREAFLSVANSCECRNSGRWKDLRTEDWEKNGHCNYELTHLVIKRGRVHGGEEEVLIFNRVATGMSSVL